MTTFDRERVRGSAETLRDKRVQISALAIPPGRGWEPLRDRMAGVLGAPSDDIGQVVAKLETVGQVLGELPPSPATNRVTAFNEL